MKSLLTISLLFFVVFACKQKEEPKTQQGWPSPPTQVGQGNTLTQEKLLKDAVSKDPRNADAWIQLGNLMMDSSRFNEAVDAYTKGVEINPKNVDARVDMATCLRNAGKPDLAIKEYRKAIETNPNHVYAHVNLGVVLANDKKDYSDAIIELEKGLSLNPNLPNAPAIRQEIQRLKRLK